MADKPSNVVTDFDPDEWDVKVEPFAPTFKFSEEKPETRILVGTYKSNKVVELDDPKAENGKRASNVYTIVRSSDGEEFSVWGSYNVDAAFESIVEGQTVRIEFLGQVDASDGQRVNRFHIATKK